MDMIDTSNARDNIAFVNEVPWHRKGQQLTIGADIDTWTREAGLLYTVRRAPVEFMQPALDGTGEQQRRLWADRHVLYRDDTNDPLSVCGKDYKIVQPGTIMEFFRELCANNSFTMEVAGALDGGKRVWALAKVNDGAPVIGHDVVRPYVLLCTSYDGTLSTTAKFTSVRVVCHNTLTMSAGYGAQGAERGQTESDKTKGAVKTAIRIPHSAEFNAREARMDLGIVLNAYDRFMVDAKLLSETKVDEDFVIAFLKELLPSPGKIEVDGKMVDKAVEDTKAFKRLLDLCTGVAPSATLPEAKGTAWGVLNAVTWYVDHERGRDGTRLSQAWFGAGEGMKNGALELLTKVCA